MSEHSDYVAGWLAATNAVSNGASVEDLRRFAVRLHEAGKVQDVNQQETTLAEADRSSELARLRRLSGGAVRKTAKRTKG